ncbi:MAG: diguanylate cyclase [Longicatena sp.]
MLALLNFTISIGAASYYHSDTSAQDAMKRVDRSLYKAKIAGRNKVCILK